MQKFIVLRDRQRVTGPFRGSRGVGPQARAFAPSEAQIEVEEVDRTGRSELLRDPEVLAVTPAMPIRLIEPLDAEDDSDDEAWGVAAVGADTTRFTGTDTVVAVLDTGIDSAHPAFDGVTLVEGGLLGQRHR